MKVLLDHCVDRRLVRAPAAHEVDTAARLGRQALGNGALPAAAAAAGFEAFITVDKNLRHQQNIATLPLSVIVLHVRDTQLPSLLALATSIEAALSEVARYRLILVHRDGRLEMLSQRGQ